MGKKVTGLTANLPKMDKRNPELNKRSRLWEAGGKEAREILEQVGLGDPDLK